MSKEALHWLDDIIRHWKGLCRTKSSAEQREHPRGMRGELDAQFIELKATPKASQTKQKLKIHQGVMKFMTYWALFIRWLALFIKRGSYHKKPL